MLFTWKFLFLKNILISYLRWTRCDTLYTHVYEWNLYYFCSVFGLTHMNLIMIYFVTFWMKLIYDYNAIDRLLHSSWKADFPCRSIGFEWFMLYNSFYIRSFISEHFNSQSDMRVCIKRTTSGPSYHHRYQHCLGSDQIRYVHNPLVMALPSILILVLIEKLIQ